MQYIRSKPSTRFVGEYFRIISGNPKNHSDEGGGRVFEFGFCCILGSLCCFCIFF